MRIGKLTTHLPKMGGLHIAATIEAKDRPIFKRLNGIHHTSLGVASLDLPFLALRFALLWCGSLNQRMQLDGECAAYQLHPLTQSHKLAGKYGIAHPKTGKRIGDAATIASMTKTSNTFEISNLQLTNLCFCH